MNSAATHRPEIGGLRAIAVVAVLVYHADFPFLTGGFVGVDVFFVLSGFLVASMLMRTDPSGQVNLNKFFDRRLRRIFPALVPCFIASWLVSFNVMNETQFADFNRSLAASAVFGANFFFWSSIGYFDGSAELKPLLHMWSLGIEIQFYLFYAVLVWALVKFKFTLLIPTLGLLIVSMVWAVVTVAGGNADAAFYLPHLRLWEMLAGSALAFIQFRRLNTYVSTSIELVGILLIMVPMISYAEGYPAFPGLSALPPVLGTVLIVAANNGGAVVAPALRNPILQAVGNIVQSLPLAPSDHRLYSFSVAGSQSNDDGGGSSFVNFPSFHFISTCRRAFPPSHPSDDNGIGSRFYLYNSCTRNALFDGRQC